LGTSFDVIWPVKSDKEDHENIIKAAVTSVRHAWSDLKLSDQPLSEINRCIFWLELDG
jgi:hypothetical protein